MGREERIRKAREMAKGAGKQRKGIVAAYNERWGPLNQRRLANLLESPIVASLARRDTEKVVDAIQKNQHFADIYQAVVGRPYEPPSSEIGRRVWISGGGRVFHRGPDCAAMLEGKTKAKNWGYGDRAVSAVNTTDALARGRTACLVCIGPDPKYREGVLDDPFFNH